MIEPPPRSIIDGALSLERCHTAVVLISRTRRNNSRDSSSIPTTSVIPALLTSTSTRPWVSIVSAMSRSRSSSFAISAAIGVARSLPSSSASASRRSRRRAEMTTVAPTACMTRAMRSPRPADAPVMTTTVSSSRKRSRGCVAVDIPPALQRSAPVWWRRPKTRSRREGCVKRKLGCYRADCLNSGRRFSKNALMPSCESGVTIPAAITSIA